MEKLLLILDYLPHPYGQDNEVWGKIQFWYQGANTNPELLLTFQWDVSMIINWFSRNIDYIASERLEDVKEEESLSQALLRIRRTADDDDDETFDRLYMYESRHDLGFGARGARVPPIIFGINGGRGEVSLDMTNDPSKDRYGIYEGSHPEFFKDGTWKFVFDMPEFRKMIDDLAERHSNKFG